MIDPNYKTPRPDGTVYYWTEEEIAQRKKEEEEALKGPPKSPVAQAGDVFLSLPLDQQIKPENAIPFLLAEFYNRLGSPSVIPAIAALAQPTPEAEPKKQEILEKFKS